MLKKQIIVIAIGVVFAMYILLGLIAMWIIKFSLVGFMVYGFLLGIILLIWIRVVLERLKELKDGETDDLSKY